MKNKKEKKGFLRKLSSIDEIKSSISLSINMFKNLKESRKKEYIIETFEEALNRLGINKDKEQEQLEFVYKNFKFKTITYFLFSLFAFLLNTFNILNGNQNILTYGFYFFVVILLLFSFNSSFRCYQIRKRKLGGLKDFCLSIKEWIPKKYNYKESLNVE